MSTVNLSAATFEQSIRGNDIVLVDFWAAWCGPCQMMAPAFKQAGAQLQGRALLVKVDSDASPGLSQRFGIRSLPTLVRLQGGRETARQSGAVPASAMVSKRRPCILTSSSGVAPANPAARPTQP